MQSRAPPTSASADHGFLGPNRTQHNRTPRSRNPVYGPSPGTPSKRRMNPRGIPLGTWNQSGLRAELANAVYGSRDIKNRINRRISKESVTGRVVTGGNYNHKKTACFLNPCIGNWRCHQR